MRFPSEELSPPKRNRRFSSTSSRTASARTSRQMRAAHKESTALSRPDADTIPAVRTLESRKSRTRFPRFNRLCSAVRLSHFRIAAGENAFTRRRQSFQQARRRDLTLREHGRDGLTQALEPILLRDQHENFADPRDRRRSAGVQPQVVAILLRNRQLPFSPIRVLTTYSTGWLIISPPASA